MSVVMVTANGEEHGLVNSVANSVKCDNFMRFAEKDRESMKKLKAKEEKLVKARYVNYRGNNERLSRPYMRWDGEPIKFYNLIPNQVYELPQGFITEVNENPGIAKRSGLLDTAGNPSKVDGQSERIHELFPAEF